MFLQSKPLNLARKRVELGLSFSDLGQKCGLNPSTLCKMESNKRRVAPRTAKIVADTLGTSIYDLFDLINEGGDQA